MKLAYPYVLSNNLTRAPLAWEGEFESIFPRIAEIGYKGLELLAYRPDECDLEGVRKTAAEHGLRVAALGTGLYEKRDGLSLVHKDEDIRLEARQGVKSVISAAAVFGAAVVIGRIRGRWAPLGSPETAFEYFEEALDDLLECAGKLKVPLMIEPQSESASDFITTIDEGLSWCRHYPELSLVCDTFHMDLTEEDPGKALRAAEGHIGLIHLADSERLLPGKGRIDFKQVNTILSEIEYREFCSMEFKQAPGPEEACREAFNFMMSEDL